MIRTAYPDLTIQKLATKVDVVALEKELPPKTMRSHHVVVSVEGVNKQFGKTEVLKQVELKLYAGEFAIIYGSSGCGKSTLLHTILGLEPPTSGKVYLRKANLYTMNEDERTNFRREKVGMVFQRSEWIKSLTVWENVAYPLLLAGKSAAQAKLKAVETLTEVEMGEWAEKLPMELSGGQQQRVAMARALITDPWIIIADEPTGNLDSKSSVDLIKILTKLNRLKSRLVLMVTHDVGFLPLATRRIGMIDGAIVKDEVDDEAVIESSRRQNLTLQEYERYWP